MSAAVARVGPSTPVARARGLLRRYAIGHLPVIRRRRLVGIVTEGDLRLDRPRTAGRDGSQRPPATPTVREVMSRPVVTVRPDETIAEASRLMLAARVRCLPVVDGGRLVGMLTAADVLRAVAAADGKAE